MFPPTAERPGSHGLRIESWANDPRSLFLEIVSTYGPVRADGALVQVEENIHASYRFLTEPAMRFVAGFDTNGGTGDDEDDGEDDSRP